MRVETRQMSDLATEDICHVSAADICPASTADICPLLVVLHHSKGTSHRGKQAFAEAMLALSHGRARWPAEGRVAWSGGSK